MPEATPELRAAWPGGDSEAIAYLEGCGYELTRDFRWKAPGVGHKPSPREDSALEYLWQEWDFGGIVE